MMWVDFIILTPVLVFLLWLYWFSRPAARLGPVDRLVLGLTPLLVTGTLWAVHASLDVEGMGLNVIAVAAGYLVGCMLLGAGWGFRVKAARKGQGMRSRGGQFPPGRTPGSAR